MTEVRKLRKYYVDNIEKKVFLEEKVINGKKYCILYIHNISEEEKSFVDTFTQYFPYYVWNEDQLRFIDIDTNADKNLEVASKKCWKSETVPKRNPKVNGIYGEVFLDFYERIVHDRRIISTYASRRAYKSKEEAKGYDHIGYWKNGNALEIVLGEAKYVTTVHAAKTALKEDVDGKFNDKGRWVPGHLTEDYFDSFMNFIVQAKDSFSEVEQEEIKDFIRDLNKELVQNDGKFLQYIINKNIKINCVFFAIFQDDAQSPEDFEKIYDEIYVEAEIALKAMKVSNYSIEIVFIPTKARSMQIKEKIDEFYRKN